jgi:hypothetical protein
MVICRSNLVSSDPYAARRGTEAPHRGACTPSRRHGRYSGRTPHRPRPLSSPAPHLSPVSFRLYVLSLNLVSVAERQVTRNSGACCLQFSAWCMWDSGAARAHRKGGRRRALALERKHGGRARGGDGKAPWRRGAQESEVGGAVSGAAAGRRGSEAPNREVRDRVGFPFSPRQQLTPTVLLPFLDVRWRRRLVAAAMPRRVLSRI